MKTTLKYKVSVLILKIKSWYDVNFKFPYQRAVNWFDESQIHFLSDTILELYLVWLEHILESKNISAQLRAEIITIVCDLKASKPYILDYSDSRAKWFKEDMYKYQLKIRKALKKAADLNEKLCI